MTARTIRLALGLALLPAALSSAQTPRDGAAVLPPLKGQSVISGVVLTADEPASPVRLARVTLNSVDRGGAADTTTTDVNGRFVLRDVPAGRYTVQATKRAWLDANYGAARIGRPGTPIAVKDGEVRDGLTIRMIRGAVIAGVVRDSSGDPQPGIQVRVLRFVMKDGARSLERPASSNLNDPVTDDEGHYRVYGLAPGDYLVVAGARLGSSGGLGGDEIRPIAPGDVDRAVAGGSGAVSSAVPRADTRSPVTNAPIYFPGTTDLSAAGTITLAPAEERTGIDIPFAFLPAARVTGTITLAPRPESQPAESDRAECRMTPTGFEELMAEPLAASTAGVLPDGRVLFPAIPPGHYTIVCVRGRPSGPGGPLLLGWAETAVVVNGQDLDVALAFGPATELSGRVVFEGATPPADASTLQLQIQMRPLGKARLLRAFNISPAADGTFKFGAVVPGGWAIGVNLPRTSPWTVKSLTLAGRDLHDNLIQVSGAETLGDLVITLTDRPSELGGALQDATGRPATEYFVIAFSTDRTAWTSTSRRIQSARPASDGAFSIKGLPGGEYYLAALTDVEPGEWLSASFLDQIVASAVRVRVIDGEKTTQVLRIAR
jgi:hypothetical protein